MRDNTVHMNTGTLNLYIRRNQNFLAKNTIFLFSEKELGIEPILTAHDMAYTDIPDKLSMVAYLSNFFTLFRKESIEPEVSKTDQTLVLEVPGKTIIMKKFRKLLSILFSCI